MSVETSPQLPLEESVIVDTDVHVMFNLQDDIAPHITEPNRSWINPEAGSYESVHLEDGWPVNVDGRIKRPGWGGGEAIRNSDDLRGELFELFHIDHAIINNFFPSFVFGNRVGIVNEIMPVYNDLLLERFLDDDPDLYGLMGVGLQDPHATAEEIDRLGNEKKIVGLFIVSIGSRFPLGDPYYDVMYKAAEDNDLAIVYHSDLSGFPVSFPHQNYGLRTGMEVHTLAHPWAQMETMTSLITQGTFEKFPDLDFVFVEAGLAWVPYLMYRLNKEYSMRKIEAPLLKKSPEAYIRERCYFTSQPIGEPDRSADLQPILDVLGADNILFASDFPHIDMDHPDMLDAHLRSVFSEEDRQKVLNANAMKVFDIP